MNNTVAIVVPVYKSTLSWNEQVSWNRCKEVFKENDIIIVHPEGLDISQYAEGMSRSIAIPAKYFKTVHTYSHLMCLPFFYKYFLSYKYILLYQLDTFVFENNLDEWCKSGIDYVGAPWIKAGWIEKLKAKIPFIDKIIYPVGNGGLSLRKVKKFYYASIYLFPLTVIWKRKWHEDFFWATAGKRLVPGFKIPTVETALKFAFEENPEKLYELNGKNLPFGCHAWEKFNPEFWKPHFKKYGYDISEFVK